MELAKVSLKLRQILYQCLYDLKILQCIHINRVCLVHYIGVAVGIVNRKLGVQRLCTVKVNGAVGAVQCLQSLSAGMEELLPVVDRALLWNLVSRFWIISRAARLWQC